MSAIKLARITDTAKAEEAAALFQEVAGHLSNAFEDFYQTGVKLRRIAAEKTWQKLGYKSYAAALRAELDISISYAHQLIEAARIRPRLPTLPNAKVDSRRKNEWRETSIRPLARLETDSDRVRVANKVRDYLASNLDEVISARLVASFVAKDIGRKKQKPRRLAAGPGNVQRYLDRYAEDIAGWHESLEGKIPKEGWVLLCEEWPEAIGRLIDSCDSLASFLRRMQAHAKSNRNRSREGRP